MLLTLVFTHFRSPSYSFFMVGYGPTISTNVLLQILPNGSIMNNYGRVVGLGQYDYG